MSQISVPNICLHNIEVKVDFHYILTDFRLEKGFLKDYFDDVANEIFETITFRICKIQIKLSGTN